MLWVKAFHVIAMVAWFAGLFYLPRLFVYHTLSEDKTSRECFKIMEIKLYKMIMHPAALLTVLTGIWLLWDYAWQAYQNDLWLHLKLFLVVLLVTYHFYCGKLVNIFAENKNTHSHRFYRFFNEVPTLLLIATTILVVVKPM